MTTPRRFLSVRLLFASGLFLLVSHVAPALPVFPGATGYGTQTVAARGVVNGSTGVTVYKVTTLADTTGTPTNGMLRYGVETLSGARVIIFEVSGVIALRKNLTIRHNRGFLTIAGQTAPAGGITLKNAGIVIKSNDVLIQHIAIRPGDLWWNANGTEWQEGQPAPGCSITQPAGYALPCPDNRDAIILNCDPGQQTYNIVLDHVSASWGTDENVSLWGNDNQPIRDITISNSFITEALRHAGNTQDTGPDGHSAGLILGPNTTRISLPRNVMAFNRWRNPLVGYDTVADVRIINNLVYAPGEWTGHRVQVGVSQPLNDTSYTVRMSVDGSITVLHPNPQLYGYNANNTPAISIHQDSATNVHTFLNNNRLYHPTSGWIASTPNYNSTLVHQGTTVTQLGSDPFTADGVTPWPSTWTEAQVETALLNGSGSRPAVRDAADARLVGQIAARTVRDWLDDPDEWYNPSLYPGLGTDGYPTAAAIHTLTPPTGAAGQADPDNNGYTALEEWLHDFSTLVESGGDPIDPATPILDNFEDNVANGWTASGTTNWAITSVGAASTPEHNRVYAQTNTTLDARSVLSGTNWTDQVVQADIKPTSLPNSNSWVGVLGRYRDPSNYYYFIIRQSGVIDLKKIVGGTASSLLSSTPGYTVNTSNTYRLKLVMNGTAITGTVSTWNPGTNTWTSVQTVSATDSSIASGRAGLGMFRTAAQFNTVFASPNPTATNLFGDDFQDQNPSEWTTTGGTWTTPLVGGSYVYRQSSTGIGYSIYATAGQGTWANQTLRAYIKPTAFNAATTTPFFGLVARHTNSSNYYYFIVRKNNTVELKKYASGVQGTLDSANYTVTTGTTYDLRIDAIGPTLNAYIGQRLVLEAQDTSNATGKVGFQLLDAAIEADDVLVTSEP